jgi:energy-coupling factor transport system permease protein
MSVFGVIRHPRDMAPLLKFLAMLGFVAAAYAISDLRLVVLLIAAEGAIALGCGVGRAFRLTLVALLFGALTLCLFQIFTISDGRPVFYLLPWWKWGRVTDVGLYGCLLLALRMIASVGSIPLMLSLTSQTQVMSLISGNFRLPSAYSIMLVTALRFIPTFGDRMRLVLQAEASRGYNTESSNPLRRIGMVLRLSLPLLVSCARDVDTLALSIETRGFDPRSGIRPRAIPPLASDWLLLALCLAAQGAIVAADKILIR